MKKMFLLILTLTILFACKTKKDVDKNENKSISKMVQIIRDCTGTYIRINEKDYKVCNEAILKDVESEFEVRVKYIPIDNCPVKEGIVVCMMYHESAGFVEVTKY